MSETEGISEEQAWEITLADHPELRDAYLDDSLPEEATDENGEVWNPVAHLILHSIVEQQIGNDQPVGIAKIVQEIEETGISRHETRHLVAERLTGQIWGLVQEKGKFDEQQYMSELRETRDQAVRRSSGQ